MKFAIWFDDGVEVSRLVGFIDGNSREEISKKLCLDVADDELPEPTYYAPQRSGYITLDEIQEISSHEQLLIAMRE